MIRLKYSAYLSIDEHARPEGGCVCHLDWLSVAEAKFETQALAPQQPSRGSYSFQYAPVPWPVVRGMSANHSRPQKRRYRHPEAPPRHNHTVLLHVLAHWWHQDPARMLSRHHPPRGALLARVVERQLIAQPRSCNLGRRYSHCLVVFATVHGTGSVTRGEHRQLDAKLRGTSETRRGPVQPQLKADSAILFSPHREPQALGAMPKTSVCRTCAEVHGRSGCAELGDGAFF